MENRETYLPNQIYLERAEFDLVQFQVQIQIQIRASIPSSIPIGLVTIRVFEYSNSRVVEK